MAEQDNLMLVSESEETNYKKKQEKQQPVPITNRTLRDAINEAQEIRANAIQNAQQMLASAFSSSLGDLSNRINEGTNLSTTSSTATVIGTAMGVSGAMGRPGLMGTPGLVGQEMLRIREPLIQPDTSYLPRNVADSLDLRYRAMDMTQDFWFGNNGRPANIETLPMPEPSPTFSRFINLSVIFIVLIVLLIKIILLI